jgi:zinc transport system substrate-binding protein
VIHTHGPDGEGSHSGTASTTWLDPELAVEHARAIAEALSQRQPQRRELFSRNLERLERDLVSLDQRLQKIAEKLGQRPLVFSHPVYQYLERRYRLNGRSLHWEPDQRPTPEMWQELERLLETHPARLMIWEAPPHVETRQRVETLGLASAVYAPSPHPPETGNWLEVMESNAAALEALLLEDVEPD